ncbi:type B DNA-directed DNA polymerase [Halorubrum ezzemoulense]|uniref:type B DNA-directed DNA polymerase n=1 Tax=Halorubrum ezzemoulense TaxID=337243 RepID=UPI00232DF245|nr:type B DNA-directed DNA polymerase [Halorubrum ezzemoulense]MDB2242664.1 type B DNA-directed DNA polymerase [Halorubrum ezzemoulense]
MTLTLDYLGDGRVAQWTLTPDGVARDVYDDYRPTLFVGDAPDDLYGWTGGPDPSPPSRDGLSDALSELLSFLGGQQAVADLGVESHRQTFRTDARPLLRVDTTSIEAVRTVAKRVRQFDQPDTYTCYNVDFTRQLRFCLETDTPAGPDRSIRSLQTLRLEFPSHESGIESLPQLTVDSERVGSSPHEVLDGVQTAIDERDPDVLVVSTADLVPLLFEAADAYGIDFALGRRPGYTKLAGESTYTSYGNVGHSPARYTVPGRVILDESNSFFYHESGLEGCLDLVARSGLPLAELGWASIGRVLTAMQIREARKRDVVVPWRAWRPELFKSALTLDAADRGGTTFAPDVGVHEDVYELDFASLYPNIIRTRNISPETVRCGCCETADVPGLGYSICERDGYLPEVLGPLIDARSEIKEQIPDADGDERERLEAASSAIKWILVSCFGYQGFSNAKFGRIECHEAINAFAREILLDAKAALEEAGWRVVHGIVDSIWMTPADDREQRPLEEVASKVSGEVGIELEYECAFEWVAFCPLRNSESGALTRYFGKRRGEEYPEAGLGDAIKTRGIERRQRSTSTWFEEVQNEALRVFDETRSPEAVCDVLRRRLRALREGAVDPSELVVDNRVSKDIDDYSMETLTVAALKRARIEGAGLAPGQTVRYVVVDADACGASRVRLEYEDLDRYDAGWYEDAVVRAVESILAPVGWREGAIRQYLSGMNDETLEKFVSR